MWAVMVRIISRLVGLLAAATLVPLVGIGAVEYPPQPSLPAPAVTPAPQQQTSAGYLSPVDGDFGGPGNPYGPDPTGYGGYAPGGAFSDNLPATNVS